MQFQENALLSSYTTFRIGGPAQYFCLVKTKEEIIEAIKWAKENELPYFILGSGSNLLVSDKGFDGLVIKIQSFKFEVANSKIITESGILLGRLVMESTKAGLSGLEWAVGIPGTVGAAIFGNSGAMGRAISEIVCRIKTLNPENFELKEYSNQQCEFEYRGSVFKKNKEIILEVELEFKKDAVENIQTLVKENLNSRKKIPPYPSAGSIFKNQEVKNLNEEILKIIPPEKIKGGKIPTAYLIERCGLKGKEIGGAKISNEHANFIVNFNNARAGDVVALINLCKKEVKDKFGIPLEEEIGYLGF